MQQQQAQRTSWTSKLTCSTLRRVEPNATPSKSSPISLVGATCSTLRRVEPNATCAVGTEAARYASCSTLRRVEPNATQIASRRVLQDAYLAASVPTAQVALG